jgi:predicted nuclease with TOPRIM domain
MRSSKTSEELEDELALMVVDKALESMPDLVNFEFRICNNDNSDLEEDSKSLDDESEDLDDDKDELGKEADNEELWADAEFGSLFRLGITKQVNKSIKQMYSMCCKEPHNQLVL